MLAESEVKNTIVVPSIVVDSHSDGAAINWFAFERECSASDAYEVRKNVHCPNGRQQYVRLGILRGDFSPRINTMQPKSCHSVCSVTFVVVWNR